MPKRFSRYNFALKAAGGAGAAGSPLSKYKSYKTGETTVNYPTNPASNPGEFKQIFLSPFAAPPDSVYFAQIGTRAQNKMPDLGTTVTNCHHLTDGTNAVLNPGYSPAKAVVQTGGTGTDTETSKITGLTYKKATGAASYTVPFGAQKSAGDNRFFLNVITAIRTAVEAKSSAFSVSFQPERFYL